MKNLNKEIKIRKNCSRCRENKDISCFCKDSKSKDGFKASCKNCISLYMKEYAFKNKIK